MNKKLAILAILGSASVLIGALGFQYIGGLPPCKLCIWQRWPHLIAIFLGLGFILTLYRSFALGAALATLTTAIIGVYHFGVEHKWWEGPKTCSSGDISTLNTDELMKQILATPVTRCDDILWSFMGISMAGWNALISFGLCLIWLRVYQASSSASQ